MKHTHSLPLIVLVGSLFIGCDRHKPSATHVSARPANASAWSAEDVSARPAEFLAEAERQVAASITAGEKKIQSIERRQTELSDKLRNLRGSSTPGQPNPLEKDYALAVEQNAAEAEHARAALTELKKRRDQLVIGRERVQLKVHDQDIFTAIELATSALILADREFPATTSAAPAAPVVPVAARPAVVQNPAVSNPRPSGPAGGNDHAVNQVVVSVDAAIREKRFDDALELCRRAESMRSGAAQAAAARGRTLDAIYGEAQRLERRGNAVEAIQLYRKAADSNHVASQLNLGNVYREGQIVQKNPTEAMKWYRLAAGQGYDKAQANLGMMLYERGTPQDKAEGVKWLQQAARNGNTGAQNALNQLRVKW